MDNLTVRNVDKWKTSETPFFSAQSNVKLSDYIKTSDLSNDDLDFMTNNKMPNELVEKYKQIGPNAEMICNYEHINFIFMSLSQIIKYDQFPNFYYIGFYYIEMGHLRMLGVSKKTGELFWKFDGGSNGYERKDEHIKNLTFDPHTNDTEIFTFDKFEQSISQFSMF